MSRPIEPLSRFPNSVPRAPVPDFLVSQDNALPWGGYDACHDEPTESSAFDRRAGGRVPSLRPPELTSPTAARRRETIYRYIQAHPGSHVRGMKNHLGLATGALQYHLYWLERHGLVTTRRSGFFRHVYPSRTFGDREEVLLGVLSQETPREILLCLVQRGSLSQGALAEMLGHSQPTVSWHMERLARDGVVRRTKSSRTVTYELVADRGEVLKLVETYHQAAWERWAGKLRQVAVIPARRRT
jgi:predicted ArsR family transcriptional regulator